MPRRKTPLEVRDPDELHTALTCEGHPILFGDGTILEDLVCGRCHKTLFLALSCEAVRDALAQEGWAAPNPIQALCDCDALNQVWPPPMD